MATNHIAIQVVDGPNDAPNYARDTIDVRTVNIDKAVIVKKGTVSGKPTIDFQITDLQGNQYVAMVTGKLIQTLAEIVDGASNG